ncbi:hypothetical protein [Psychrobacillus sp. L4]|uniref:hypothetical protein n=1 Tax=Psychrobacillus sp. L4 TaxID=3236892 RepID=UPI0036F20DD5
MKKNLVKTAAAAALLTSSILAFSPIAYGKSISVDQSINSVKSELNKAASQYVYPTLEGKLVPSESLYATLNSAKKNYQATRNAIVSSKLSTKEKESKLNDIDSLYNEKVSKGLVPYMDAYNYATKYLDPLMKEINEAEAKNDFATVVAGYHQLSYQLKDRTSILYRFSGKAARDLLLEKYKKPAEAKRNELTLPVTIYMKLVDLKSLYAAGKSEEVLKAYAELNILLEGLPKTNKYAAPLFAEVAKIKAIIDAPLVALTEQQAFDSKVADFVEKVNAGQKNITVSSTASNSLTVTIKEDVSILEFLSQGFYTSLISGLNVTKINGNDPLSEAAMNGLKAAFSADAKTLADLKGKSFPFPLTVNAGSEFDVIFTIAFN